MGKVRVKTFGDERVEQEQSREARSRLARKKEEKSAKRIGKAMPAGRQAPGLKGGQRITVVGPSEEELEKLSTADSPRATAVDGRPSTVDGEQKQKKEVKKKTSSAKRLRSKRYKEALVQVDRTKRYSINEALELLPKVHLAKFDETVEMHINTEDTGVSAQITLPHGSGKKVRVAIASEELIAEIEQGKVQFDVLLATPDAMPKLAKVAKILGPKGLMPNPKNGTITQDPKKTALQFEAGQTILKTESKAPVMHVSVGKLSFGDKKLLENITVVLTSLKNAKVKNVTLKSTMSPGIKLKLQA